MDQIISGIVRSAMMPREQEFHGFQEDDLQQEEAKEKARNFNLLYNCHLLESGIVSRTKDRDGSWGDRLGGGIDNLTNFIDLVNDWPTKKVP